MPARLLVGLMALAPLLALSAAVAPAASAEEVTNPNRFSLSAEGDGMYVEVADNGLPATTSTEASPYSSFAQVNSQGLSKAFAGLPYLGALAQTLPGTVNGLSGGALPPLPPAPGYVETKAPTTTSAKESQGPYLITANSTEFASRATAGSGVSPTAGDPRQQIYSVADVVAKPDGSVVSTASAGVDGIRVGPLSILNFTSSETLIETGEGEPKVTSQNNVGTIEVLGFRLGIDQNGFSVLGSSTRVPTATVFDAVNTALGIANMKIDFIPRSKVKNDVSGVTTVTSGPCG